MYVRSYIQRSHGKCGNPQEQGGIVHDIIRTSMDVGMVHCVPESMCTYVAIYREAMESVETLRNKEG